MAKYQNDKLYQKVTNKPKKFGNNNVNSINVIVNPKDEPEQASNSNSNPFVNNVLDIRPPSDGDIQQIASRAAQDGRTINAEEVRNAGTQNEISEAMQQNAEMMDFQQRYEEMEQDNDRLKELVNDMGNVYADDAAQLTEEVRKREQIILEMQQQSREAEALREATEDDMLYTNKIDDLGDVGDIPSPPQKEIFAKLQQIDAQWERLWNSIQNKEDVTDLVAALIQEDRMFHFVF